jgi:hypothetical protein
MKVFNITLPFSVVYCGIPKRKDRSTILTKAPKNEEEILENLADESDL